MVAMVRWECLIVQCNLGCYSLGAWFFVTTTPFLLNLEGIYTWKNFLITWFLGSAICSLVWAGSMVLWVYILGLRYPAPMVGLWSTGWGLFAQVHWCSKFYYPHLWFRVCLVGSSCLQAGVLCPLSGTVQSLFLVFTFVQCLLRFSIVAGGGYLQ